ncbi:DUF3147 family protein [candidate division WOR-3 bacterium]|nr:DUF3147 family protein [candidate division WOR-3 bacterium]
MKIAFSFFVAGFWISFTTALAERLGSKTGGLVSNLPSNILVSFVFIALAKNTNYVRNASVSVPVGMTIDTLFLVVFTLFLRFGLATAIISSLVLWFSAAYISCSISLHNYGLNLIIYLAVTGVSFLILEKALKIRSKPGDLKRYSCSQIFFRAFFAGSVVSTVVALSEFLGPQSIGIIATFPAVLLSTMVILTVSRGNEFARSTAKILVLSSTNIIVYIFSVYLTYPVIGIIFGTIVSFAVSLFYIAALRQFVEHLTR